MPTAHVNIAILFRNQKAFNKQMAEKAEADYWAIVFTIATYKIAVQRHRRDIEYMGHHSLHIIDDTAKRIDAHHEDLVANETLDESLDYLSECFFSAQLVR